MSTASLQCTSNGDTSAYLEVCIDNVKALRVLRQLNSDVSTAHKDGLQGLPFLLDIQPGVQYNIDCAQLLLPVCHNLQELRVTLKVNTTCSIANHGKS